MGELLLLLLVMGVAALAIAWPLLDRVPPELDRSDDGQGAAAAVRHRLALEALRDIEADRRAGSLDDESYAAQRAEAEARAAETLATPDGAVAASPTPVARGSRGIAVLLGIGLAALVLLGFALPAPVGIGERTVTDQALADALAEEEARQAEIERLLGRLEANPRDAEALSGLADAYLAGGSAQDQQRGALVLIALLSVEPENASAYRRLITAYLNAGDWPDARSALEAYASVAPADEPDIPFFRGLLALRADDDPSEAVRQFDKFLELAPHDPRAGMVISLRERAAAADGG